MMKRTIIRLKNAGTASVQMTEIIPVQMKVTGMNRHADVIQEGASVVCHIVDIPVVVTKIQACIVEGNGGVIAEIT